MFSSGYVNCTYSLIPMKVISGSTSVNKLMLNSSFGKYLHHASCKAMLIPSSLKCTFSTLLGSCILLWWLRYFNLGSASTEDTCSFGLCRTTYPCKATGSPSLELRRQGAGFPKSTVVSCNPCNGSYIWCA